MFFWVFFGCFLVFSWCFLSFFGVFLVFFCWLFGGVFGVNLFGAGVVVFFWNAFLEVGGSWEVCSFLGKLGWFYLGTWSFAAFGKLLLLVVLVAFHVSFASVC